MAQNAADAAALAGVPYLPQDLPSARVRALEVAARNGYDNTGNNTVTVTLGEKATQLKVTIRSVIKNTFGAVIGVPTITIEKSGTADYQGPAPMGSPCNTFGNEPNAGTGGSSGPLLPARAQGTSPLNNCLRTRRCGPRSRDPRPARSRATATRPRTARSGVDGCTSGNNDEYDEFGYVFVVKVDAAAVNTPVELQLYDPMFVNTGNTCDLLPDAPASRTTTATPTST